MLTRYEKDTLRDDLAFGKMRLATGAAIATMGPRYGRGRSRSPRDDDMARSIDASR